MKRKSAAKRPQRDSARPIRKREWPVGKPIPNFADAAEEDLFWGSYSFADVMDAQGEKKPAGGPVHRHKPRRHVYRIRLDDAEREALLRMAERRGVTASVIIRELVRAHWAKLHHRAQ